MFLLTFLLYLFVQYQIVLLYGRTLELSSSPQIKFRAHSIFRSLFELCQNHYIAGATKTKDATEWLEDPQSWFLLGQEIEQSAEPLVAKDAYQKFMELKQKQATMAYKFENKDVSAHLDVASCLKLALSCARYQNYAEAIRYGELGLQVDRYNKELRAYMSRWSELHAEELQGEVKAVRSILSVWKGRCWTNGFRRKLKQKMIQDNEERYRLDRFDSEARENLAYYAKDKYRARFMFEEYCAVRLQRFVRKRKKHSVWMDAQWQHQFTLASEVMRRYQRFPYVATLRSELVTISRHRFAPRNHPIHEAREEILRQDKAVRVLDRLMHTSRIRRALYIKINETKKQRAMKLYLAARRIQCGVRRMQAFATLEAMYARRERCAEAAIVVQRWIRRFNRSFYVSVIKMQELRRQERRNAMIFLAVKLPAMIRAFLHARRLRSEFHKTQEAEAKDRYVLSKDRRSCFFLFSQIEQLFQCLFLSPLSFIYLYSMQRIPCRTTQALREGVQNDSKLSKAETAQISVQAVEGGHPAAQGSQPVRELHRAGDARHDRQGHALPDPRYQPEERSVRARHPTESDLLRRGKEVFVRGLSHAEHGAALARLCREIAHFA